MKITLFLFLSIILFGCYSEDDFDHNNLITLYNRYKIEYDLITDYSDFSYFKGCKFTQFESSSNSDLPILLSISKNGTYYFFGMIITSNTKPIYKYDLDGDDIVDFQFNEYFFPATILLKLKENRGNIDDFLLLLARMYSQFNSMESPNSERNIINSNITKLIENYNTPNRDLILMYTNYIDIGTKIPSYGIVLMRSLINNIEIHSSKKVPLLYLFLAESYIQNGDFSSSKDVLTKLIDIDEQSLIGNYSLALIEKRINKNESSLNEFKRKHPSFWRLKID